MFLIIYPADIIILHFTILFLYAITSSKNFFIYYLSLLPHIEFHMPHPYAISSLSGPFGVCLVDLHLMLNSCGAVLRMHWLNGGRFCLISSWRKPSKKWISKTPRANHYAFSVTHTTAIITKFNLFDIGYLKKSHTKSGMKWTDENFPWQLKLIMLEAKEYWMTLMLCGYMVVRYVFIHRA